MAEGGSNGHRFGHWTSWSQQRFADRPGLHLTVCHYPKWGASKWNPVEQRLLGTLRINWAGHPLRSLEILLRWIRGTQVGGEGVPESVDRATYPTKVKMSDKEENRPGLE